MNCNRTFGVGILAVMAFSTIGELAGVSGAGRAAAAAADIAIVKGSHYTTDLRDNLVAAGQNVTELTSYTAATLGAYDAVIEYGNAFNDMGALETYVNNGGTLIQTPWFWTNLTPTPALEVFVGGIDSYSAAYPGVTVLDGADSLLAGVTFPAGSGGFNVGRSYRNCAFASGVNAVASWTSDGMPFIGHKSSGAGRIIAINLHVITDDTAYQVIDQAWATQLFVNAAAPLPEPSSLAALLAGAPALLARRRPRPQQRIQTPA